MLISVFRSSVRSHATHAIGELKNMYVYSIWAMEFSSLAKNNPQHLVKFKSTNGVEPRVGSHILGGYIRIDIRIF